MIQVKKPPWDALSGDSCRLLADWPFSMVVCWILFCWGYTRSSKPPRCTSFVFLYAAEST